MDWIINLAQWFGSAVCAQDLAHTYYLAGIPLPLCARCTGMYVGALLTIVYHARLHPRAFGVPRPWILVALMIFFFAWAGDGVNSTLADSGIFPSLYLPQNILRLATGALMGITLGTLISIMFNSIVWRDARPEALLATPREFIALLGLQALLVLSVASGWGLLLLPLMLASLVAILVLNGGLMSMLVASLLRRTANTWREALSPLLIGAFIALVYLDLFAFGHMLLIRSLGAPL